jgi:hypothetical protein
VPYGDTQVDLLGVLLLSSGMLGAFLFTVVQAKFKLSLLNANRLVAVLTLLGMLSFWAFIYSPVGCLINCLIIGFVSVPIVYIAYELAVE